MKMARIAAVGLWLAAIGAPLPASAQDEEETEADFLPESEVSKADADPAPAEDEPASSAKDEPASDTDAAVESAPEPAEHEATSTSESTTSEWFKVSGYVQPRFGVRYRPSAVPRDRIDYSAEDAQTGVILEGTPVDDWHYNFHLVVGTGVIDSITGVDVVDRNGDGVPDDVDSQKQRQIGIEIERATVSYTPTEWFEAIFGEMRIPFTVQQQSSNTALMFPRRSSANEVFLSGADLGALATADLSGRIRISAGVYRGSGASSVMADERGVLYAVRTDFNPLGPFPFGESDSERGPLRVGVGAGVLYFPSRRFDGAGFEGTRVRDLRASASLRLAVRGLYLQGEILRRQRTDSLSNRPLIATGGYGQASYYLPLRRRLGMSPIARIGWTSEDQSFDARTTVYTEAGLSAYVYTGRTTTDDLRVTLQYIGERRITEGENAHGGIAQVQLRW